MADSDFAWLSEHATEIHDRFAGQWVAVFQSEIIGVGATAIEAAAEAEKRQPGVDFILEKVERDVDVIYAGFCLA